LERRDAKAIAKLLIEYGQRLELAGESTYKVRAYHKAAGNLLALGVPLDEVIAKGKLRDIPGVGQTITATILGLHRDGTLPKLETLRRDVPASVLEMLAIPGVRPEKVLQIHRQLGIETLDGLEQACRRGDLTDPKGFGPALQAKILEGIGLMRQSHGQRLIHRAAELLERASAQLGEAHPELSRVALAGDYRRGCELVSDLRLVAEMADGSGIRIARLNDAIALSLTDAANYGAALLMATGSAAHIAGLQAIADERGLVLDEAGLRRGAKILSCKDEKAVYTALGLPFIEPELREGLGEIELAAAKRLPKLVKDEDLRGVLHNHTDASDGAHTLEEMAEATRSRGYSYFGVADHSKSAGYAGGLSLEQIEAQHALSDRLNAAYRGEFRIFKGIESDILLDGSLDYPDEVLASFDYVVASVHSRFRQDEEAQTARILRAVSNPYTTILGHMTGRMLLRREGYRVDVDAILQACAKHDVAVEINANPNRLDLDWRWHRRALELGCRLSINPDAHSTSELDLTRWGVRMARKGGVPRERILNCLKLPALARFLERRREARVPGARSLMASRSRQARRPSKTLS
jgi:DNA polymerase (family 10)